MPPLVQARGLRMAFGPDGDVLAGLDLEIADGEFVALVGPTGCGKTVTLRLMAGFERPTGGELRYDGESIAGPDPRRGMVFQDIVLFPWMTVLENVAFGPRVRGMGAAEARRRARESLAAVDLGPFEDRYPFELSGGMQQRAGLARVLVNDPRLILCDEPFGSLDWITREGLQDLLLALWAKTRKTVVLATHSIEEAVYLAQRVVVLTPPPAAVQEIVTVDLPAGRGGAVRFHPRYAEYVEYLGGAVAGERPADAAASRG